ncbi:alpha/beta-hydrolase [Ceratobasidium sp. AG-I]|nr:alpha/beta-hydrolase [Ceratobasidium sp. AG-I]
MPQIDLPNGVSLSYFSYPDSKPSPSRPTVVLLPALFQKAEVQFEPQIRDARLAGTKDEGYTFNFVGVDAHGHGNTTGRDTWEYADNAKDVLDALKSLGVDKFFAFGTSNGGLTAQELAIRYPENVRGLILCGSTAYPFGEPSESAFRQYLVPRWMATVPPPDLEVFNACHSSLGVAPKTADKPGSVFGDRATMQDNGERTAESAVGLELLSRIVDNYRTHTGEERVSRPIEILLNWPGSESRLSDLKAPVLILHGADDPSIPVERAEKLFPLLPKHELNRLVKLDGKGAHLINVVAEVAIETNAATRKWLDDCIEAGL